jgi:RES domain-containing protein
MALATGAKGILFPSILATGNNRVLYTEQSNATDCLDVYDRNGGLPRDQRSWE